jgi:HNH endonuclease
MTSAERAALRQRYNFRCGYCGVSETEVGAELTGDHFQPTSREGQDIPSNWVYCCFACNSAKGDYWLPDSSQPPSIVAGLRQGFRLVQVGREPLEFSGRNERCRDRYGRFEQSYHTALPRQWKAPADFSEAASLSSSVEALLERFAQVR